MSYVILACGCEYGPDHEALRRELERQMTDEPKPERKRRKRSQERDQLSIARRLMASAEKSQAIREYLERREVMTETRGGELVMPDHTADVQLLQARLKARALAQLEDILLHSTNEKHQLMAADIVMNMPDVQPLKAALVGQSSVVQATVVGEENAPVVEVPEDKIEAVHNMLVLSRQLNGRGAA